MSDYSSRGYYDGDRRGGSRARRSRSRSRERDQQRYHRSDERQWDDNKDRYQGGGDNSRLSGEYSSNVSRWNNRDSAAAVMEPTNTVMLKGLPPHTTEPVDTGECKGFAFVQFYTMEHAQYFMESYAGSTGDPKAPHFIVDSRATTLEYAREHNPTVGDRGAESVGARDARGGGGRTVKSDWLCEMCSCQNFARRTECYRCSSPRTERSKPISAITGGAGGGGSDAFSDAVLQSATPTVFLAVRGLGPFIDEGQVTELLRQFALVKSVTLVRDTTTGMSRGLAFVEFHIAEHAAYALQSAEAARLSVTAGGAPLKMCFAREEVVATHLSNMSHPPQFISEANTMAGAPPHAYNPSNVYGNAAPPYGSAPSYYASGSAQATSQLGSFAGHPQAQPLLWAESQMGSSQYSQQPTYIMHAPSTVGQPGASVELGAGANGPSVGGASGLANNAGTYAASSTSILPGPVSHIRYPPNFETHGSVYVFQSTSGYFYEAGTGYYYCPRSKLYYSGSEGVYYRLDSSVSPSVFTRFDPPLPLSVEGDSTAETANGTQGTNGVEDVTAAAAAAKSAIRKPVILSLGGGAAGSKTKPKLASSGAVIGSMTFPASKRVLNDMAKWTSSMQDDDDQEDSPATTAAESTSKTTASTTDEKRSRKAHDSSSSTFGNASSSSDNFKGTGSASSNGPTTTASEPAPVPSSSSSVCLLCRRQFNSPEQLARHEKESKLHADNLAKHEQQSQQAGYI